MAVVTTPELEMAVNAPLVEVMLLLRMMLLLMFAVANGAVLLIAVKYTEGVPVPALVPEIMLFPVMVSVPLPVVRASIPLKRDFPVPPAVQPMMLFPVMVTSVPPELVMPVKVFI